MIAIVAVGVFVKKYLIDRVVEETRLCYIQIVHRVVLTRSSMPARALLGNERIVPRRTFPKRGLLARRGAIGPRQNGKIGSVRPLFVVFSERVTPSIPPIGRKRDHRVRCRLGLWSLPLHLLGQLLDAPIKKFLRFADEPRPSLTLNDKGYSVTNRKTSC